MSEQRQNALLLLGPTGSGKTPLGQLLELRGWNGRRFVHFDFGENLRDIVSRDSPDEIITLDDIRFLREVLERGVLLEDKDFPIAARILRRFLARRRADENTTAVLNGLPRHRGQARDLDHLLHVQTVVHLHCSAETVVARIAADTGGDRRHRTDDDLAAVRNKLEIFAQRTLPLIEFYRQQGSHVARVDVTHTMTADQMWNVVTANLASAPPGSG